MATRVQILRHVAIRGVVIRCVVLLGACAAGLRAQARDATPSRDTVSRADLSWVMQTLAGEQQTLERFRGRVLIINSWATWCEPCVAELTSLAALRAAVPDSALVFALVAPQAPAPVAAFVRRRRLRLPVYLEASPAPAVYRFEAIPTTWIIDRAGRIVLRQRGAIRWDTPAMRERILGLLGNRAGQTP